jgi:DNA primase
MATQKCEHEEAKEILQKYIDNANLELSKGTFKSYERKENKVFDQSLIPTKGNSSYFQNRGFKKETIEHFQCFDCLNQKKNLYNRAVVPIFDDESRLVAFTGRSIENSYIKWLHQPKSFYKSGVLYNLNNAKYYISRLGTVILTEGPLDVWKLHEAGIYNSVALLGTTISNEQINLLKKYSTKKTILMVDPDRAGLKSMLKKNGLFDKLISHFSVYSLRHLLENDIGETNIEYINSTIKPELRKIIYDK